LQNKEITTRAKEQFIVSLKNKSENSLSEFNALKGGSKETLKYGDSNYTNFRYDVFKNEMFDGKYSGISKLVRERLNDPNFYNNRLTKMCD